MRLSASLAVFLLAAAQANAEAPCDTPRNDFDGLYCMSKIYQQADADLNTNYESLRGRLDDNARTLLRTGQLAWLRTRDQRCSRREPQGFYVDMACATRTTIARNRFLEDRRRECISTGCLPSRLSLPE